MSNKDNKQTDPETLSDNLHRQLAVAFSFAFLFSLANSLAEEFSAPPVVDIGLSVATIVTMLWAMVILVRTVQVAKLAGGSFIEKAEADERITANRNKAFTHGFAAMMIFNIILLVLPPSLQIGGDFGPFFTIGIGIVSSLISYNWQNR